MNDTLIIAAAIVGLTLLSVIIPLRLAQRRRQQKRQALTTLVREIATREQLDFDALDQDEEKVLALDSARRRLLYATAKEEVEPQLIDLSLVRSCRLTQRTTRDQQTSKMDGDILQISLWLEFKNGLSLELPMYSEVDDGVYEMLRLRDLARRWEERLGQLLRERSATATREQ